jgi:hypothetical protein
MPFRFFLVPSHLGPEAISDTLPLGVWVTGEAIDSIGDADRYVYPVETGVRYVAELERLHGASGGFAFYSDAAHARADDQPGLGTSNMTGWMRAMVQAFPGIEGPAIGPYRLRVRAVNLLPETAPATFAIGATVDTEAIDHFADEDNFTFTGAAGDLLRLTAVSDAFDAGARLSVDVISEAGNHVGWLDTGTTTKDFALPGSGTFTVRVRAANMIDALHFGPYTLSIVRR